MKILEVPTTHDIDDRTIAFAINRLIGDHRPDEVYFVVTMQWDQPNQAAYRDADDKKRGGAVTFYLSRKNGWRTPWSWEVVMFDRIEHQPIAKIQHNPTS